jgi:hypothetical protein
VSFLALVLTLAFATAPVIAASQEGATGSMGSGIMQGTTGDIRAGGTGEVSGQAREGMPEHMRGMMSEEMKAQMRERMKSQMKGEAKTGTSGRTEAEVSGEARGSVVTGQERVPAARTETSARVAGGEAVVVRVDRPDNCLRIRSGPSMSYNLIGCAVMGQTLVLTGAFSTDGRWAQLDNNGWVTFRQIRTSLKPPKRVISRVRTSDSDSDFDELWGRPAGAGSSTRVSSEPYYDTDVGYFGVPYYSYYGWPGYTVRRPALPRPPALPALPPPPRPFP